jgi:hypothetical protein
MNFRARTTNHVTGACRFKFLVIAGRTFSKERRQARCRMKTPLGTSARRPSG